MESNNEVIITLIIIILILGAVLGFKMLNKTDDDLGIEELGTKLQKSATEGMDGLETEVQKWNEHNINYEKYKGEQFGTKIKELLDYTKNNNFLYIENRKVTIDYQGKQYIDNIDNLKNLINDNAKYVVSLYYDSDTKLVNKVTIK